MEGVWDNDGGTLDGEIPWNVRVDLRKIRSHLRQGKMKKVTDRFTWRDGAYG